jgi:drug/metabolite transporter (DMT)-like permease
LTIADCSDAVGNRPSIGNRQSSPQSAIATRQPAMHWLLLLMTLIWGTNYTIVKSALGEIDAQAFNGLRMTEASVLLLSAMTLARRFRWNPLQIFYTDAPLTRRDWTAIAGLGIVGHCIYQYCFIGAMARTSVANSALILAASPVVITVLSAALGQDRVATRHWIGIALSVAGIYLVVGRGARFAGESIHGDLMMVAAVLCWAAYTLGARPLMQRHSPVGITALSMSIGTAIYLPIVSPHLLRMSWSTVSLTSWVSLVYSAAFAICVAYVIWYAGVRELGSARTAVYSNLLPVVALLTAFLWLHEPIGAVKIAGAGGILIGVAFTRARPQAPRP